MSYTTLDEINKIKNKNILILDIETTGLPKQTIKKNKPEEEYPHYTNNNAYDESRIVQIAWKYFKNFDMNFNTSDIESVIIRPKNFIIPSDSAKIHGIENDFAIKNGIKINKVFNNYIGYYIENCDYILAYNAFFDVRIIMNELYRINFTNTLKCMEKLVNNKRILCIGHLSRNICRPDNWKPFYKYQIPKQCEVYKKCYGKKPKNEHNAEYDVFAMLKILEKIMKK